MEMYADGLFEGRVALVTGGGRGIGEEIATTLAALGADVAVNDLHESSAAETVETIESLGRQAVAVPGNVADEGEVEAMVETAADTLGTPQLVVNNAGSNNDDALLDLPLEEWEKVMQVNTTAALLVGRAAAARMAADGVGGSMVNLSSIAGTMPQPGAGAYSTSKAATIMLTRQMALEWAPHDIRVNAICPGLIWTPATDSVYADDELNERRRQWVPVRRIGRPEDVARTAVYLLSPTNDYTTGESVFVDGGAQCVGLNLIPGRARHE